MFGQPKFEPEKIFCELISIRREVQREKVLKAKIVE